MSLQVLCYVEIQNTQWFCLYVRTLSVLWRKYKHNCTADEGNSNRHKISEACGVLVCLKRQKLEKNRELRK